MIRARTVHPIRDLPILTYQGEADAVAFIGGGSRFSYPYFRAATRAEALEKAQAFQNEVLADHEASFVARMAGREKAAETRAKKASAQ